MEGAGVAASALVLLRAMVYMVTHSDKTMKLDVARMGFVVDLRIFKYAWHHRKQSANKENETYLCMEI